MYGSFIVINPSRWLLLAAIFLTLSFFMPRRIPFLVAAASVFTGLFSFIYGFFNPLSFSLGVQILFFLGTLILGLVFVHQRPPAQRLNKNDHFTLKAPIVQGKGTFEKEGITYTLIGPDCPGKTKVSVVSIEGTTIYIKPLEKNE
ncbi:MAG: NfeD family protein [Alphaproteobacteria bacterium]